MRKFFLILLLAAAQPLQADTVKLAGRPPFQNVTIVGFRDGRLVFRGISEQYLRKPLHEVEWLTVTGATQLNAAEDAAAAGEWARAVQRYETALGTAGEPWLRDLTRVRLLMACDRAGYFDRAVSLYLEVLRTQAGLARRHAPRHPGPLGSDMNRRARATLEAELSRGPSATAPGPVRVLLLELLLFDEVEPLPPEVLRPPSGNLPNNADGPPSAGPGTQPAPVSQPASSPTSDEPLGILPSLVERPSPLPGSSGRPYLPADSFVLSAAQAAFDAADYARASRLLERALPFVAPAERGPWRLLLGRSRIEAGRADEAASDLLNLSESDPDPVRAAWALYYVGVARERLGKPTAALKVYEDLRQRANVPDEIKTRADEALQRLKRS